MYIMDCDRKAVCATGDDQNTSLFSYKIDTDSLVYINNWVESLNMQCTPKLYIGMIGAMAFAGVAISCLFIPQLGDKYGRHLCWMVTIIC